MTIDEIIEKEELKVDTLLNSLTENTTSFAVEDSINDILQQEYLTLVNAIGQMAKYTNVDTRACGDIVALASVVFSAVSERSHPSEAPQAAPKLTADSHNIMAQQCRLMADTLHVLARQFRAYESHHAHKGDIEKAETVIGTAADECTIIYQRTISPNDHPEWESHFMPRHYRYIVNVINGLIAFGEYDEISIQFGRREDVTAMHIFEPFSTLNYVGLMSPSVVSLCFKSSTSNVSFYTGNDNGIGIFCDSLKHETTLPLPKNCKPDIDFWHFVDSIGSGWGDSGDEEDYFKEISFNFNTPRF